MSPQAFAAQYSRDCQGNVAVSHTKVVQNAALTPPNWQEPYIYTKCHTNTIIHNIEQICICMYAYMAHLQVYNKADQNL